MSESPPTGMVAIPRDVLYLLLELPSGADMETLRAAGDEGGGALLDAFAHWCRDGGAGEIGDLPVDEFTRRCGEFFEQCGWGRASVTTSADSTIEVCITDCWESHRHREDADSGCHLTTGLLHGFFATLAGYEVGVMELECARLGSNDCRFVVGTPEMVDSIYAELSAGATYEAVVSSEN